MSDWRSPSKRPRDGQRVVILSTIGLAVFMSGKYRNTRLFDGDSGWRSPWSAVSAWIPESELIRAAREAAKGGAK